MRKPYLDNIRWATVLLVLIYHVCYLFNGVGIPGGIPNAETIPLFDGLACVVYPWFMVLLFVVAGMSSRYSLQKRTDRQFLKERTVKLLVPATLGLFVIHWITGYLNIKMGGGLVYIPSFLVYPISVLSGIGPLWFIQTLFLFSCLLVLLRKLDRSDRLWTLCGRANIVVILMLSLVIWGASQILNAPLLTMYRFGIYFAAFAIGYYVFSHDEIQDAVARCYIPILLAAVIGAVAYLVSYYGSDFTSPACLQSLLTNLYLWAAVLAIIGVFRKYCDRETAVTRYLSANSFGLYILHYPVLLCICYVLHYHTDLSPVGKYLFSLVIEFVATFLLNELLKRIPLIRFAVLGRKG